jgi:hypothetical protein
MKTTQHLNHTCIILQNRSLTLLVTQSVGPRVLSLRLGEGDNLFAELPSLTLDYPGGAKFHFYGGHRLWYAPEVPRYTYLPDDNPVVVKQLGDGIKFIQPIEPLTGIQKSISITVSEDEPLIIVNHTLTNHGSTPVEYSPWAITQMKVGGFAILPQWTNRADPAGLLPNRSMSIWPYTDIRSPFIDFGNHFILIDSTPESGPLKIGYPNPRGWLAYYQESTLFVKYAQFDPNAAYFDQGSSSECYCGPDFLELETLAPRTSIPSGETVTHLETWRVFESISLTANEHAIQELVDHLDLDNGPNSNRS